MRRIAHRGFAGEYPENTLLAFRNAPGEADVVEFDVRRCGSGDLVCIHDGTVDRVTGASGPVSAFDAAELADLSVLGTGEGVPTLGDALDAIPGSVGVNAELKEQGIAADALAALRGTSSETIVSSFFPGALEAARSERESPKEVALAYLHADPGGIKRARELGCACVHPQCDLCTNSYVAAAAEAGLSVNAWTVTEPGVARHLARVGADGAIADCAGVFETG